MTATPDSRYHAPIPVEWCESGPAVEDIEDRCKFSQTYHCVFACAGGVDAYIEFMRAIER